MFTIEFVNAARNTIVREVRDNIAAAMDCAAHPENGFTFVKFYFPGQEVTNWSDVTIINK